MWVMKIIYRGRNHAKCKESFIVLKATSNILWWRKCSVFSVDQFVLLLHQRTQKGIGQCILPAVSSLQMKVPQKYFSYICARVHYSLPNHFGRVVVLAREIVTLGATVLNGNQNNSTVCFLFLMLSSVGSQSRLWWDWQCAYCKCRSKDSKSAVKKAHVRDLLWQEFCVVRHHLVLGEFSIIEIRWAKRCTP